ncbi:MAG: hypothetical protein ABI959_09455 [Candidatus Dormiibacterota bacterium]
MLGPGLEKRLKAALDEVKPPSPTLASARYRMGVARRLSRAWRFAPALVAIAAAGAALTATAATGSPNPAIWKDRAGAALLNVGRFPSPSANPKPRVSPTDERKETSRPTPSSSHEPKESPEPRHSPEPSERPEPTPTSDSSGGHDSSGESEPTSTSSDGN